MAKNRKEKKEKGFGRERNSRFALPGRTIQWIWGILMILAAIIVSLSFFNKAGVAGQYFMKGSQFLLGEAVFLLPLIFVVSGIVFLSGKAKLEIFKGEKRVFWPVFIAIFIIILGVCGVLSILSAGSVKDGGWLGYVLSWPFIKYFGFWAAIFIFLTPILIGGLIFWQFLKPIKKIGQFKEDGGEKSLIPSKPSIIKRIFGPKFTVKEISPLASKEIGLKEKEPIPLKLETKAIASVKTSYQPPPLELLEKEHGSPASGGDIRVNSAIIKKTLQNFGIEVAMSEVNIGPTVAQYTFKPAEGVKLSKITGLSNDLALALASHPIRIEAPIPGRSLVGVEIPNKIRTRVKLRDLLESQDFQQASAILALALGKDVAGVPVYADLTKMPHLLVAGSTGTGKTIFLNSLILSLLYQPTNTIKSASPENLRFILVDPKRVEFSVYRNLPHLLCPVIYTASQTFNALKWLTSEMERRFMVLSEAGSRDIAGFNEKALKNEEDQLPFIILIIDELADLMMSKSRDIEAAIVRLAQMARAVGIHLVVATQRPSVEVITGLIKANITSRVTFQVASQVDSRTVLDMAGAEKLIGLGDMLYISAQTPKPKRIQSAYISEKEIKKVVNFIEDQKSELKTEMDADLIQELDRTAEENGEGGAEGIGYSGDGDSLYEEARKVVVESRKASASLLQRRMRIGYARAARLIDMLEEKGVVGPGDGAKPREVYVAGSERGDETQKPEDSDKGEEWEKV